MIVALSRRFGTALAIVIVAASLASCGKGSKVTPTDSTTFSNVPVASVASMTASSAGSPRGDADPTDTTRVVHAAAGSGHIDAGTSRRSHLAHRIASGAVPTASDGSLLRISRLGDRRGFILSMKADDGAELVANPGWSIARVGLDPTWTPARCGAMPNILVGTRWFALFDAITDSPDPTATGDPGPVSGDATMQLTIYDLEAKTFRNLLDSTEPAIEHTLSLQTVTDHVITYLWSPATNDPGAIDQPNTRSTTLMRRVIDLNDDTFVDRRIELPQGWELGGIFRANAELRADLRDPTGQIARTGVVEIDPDGAGRVRLLPAGSLIGPYAIDGFTVKVDYSPETSDVNDDYDTLRDPAGSVVHRFPHDRFEQVRVRAVEDNSVYFTFVRPATDDAVTRLSVGVLDLGSTLFDIGLAPQRTHPATPVADPETRAEAFIAGVQRVGPA